MKARTLAAATEALDTAGIPYALIGAMAMAARGVPRMTHDADLLAESPRALHAAVWENWRSRVRIEIRRGEPDDPLVGVVRVGTGSSRVPVDVVVPRGDWLRGVLDRARSEGSTTSIFGVSVPVVTEADLVLLKVDAGGPGDRSDIHLMLGAWRAREPEIVAHVEALVPQLGPWAERVWATVRAERGR